MKARPEDYKKAVGVRGDKVWHTLDLVLESGVDYEVRTTVYPESLIDYNFEDLVSQLKLAGVRTSHYRGPAQKARRSPSS